MAAEIQLDRPDHATVVFDCACEQSVLGGLLLDNDAWHSIADCLVADDFYRRDHQLIFSAITELAGRGEPFDVVLVAELLLRKDLANETGGLVYLASLVRDTASAANVRRYAAVVREHSTLRQLRAAAERIAAGVATDHRPAAEQIADATAALSAIQAALSLASNGKALQLLPLEEYVARPSVAWLVRDLIPAHSIVVVFGPPKSGKTHTVADMAMHAAHGMHWHGRTVSRALRVAYLAGEGHSGLRVRFHGWQLEHEAELKGDIRILAEALALVPRLEELLAMLRPYKPDLIVLDTLNAYFGAGDENSTQDMTAWVAAVRLMRDELGCAVVIVHHTGLNDGTRERGSSVLRAAADVIVQVARDESGSGLVGVQVIAARDFEPWSEPLSLRLQSVTTDWADDEGQPLTTCVIASGNAPVTLPGRGGRPLGDAQATVLAVARELAQTRRNGSGEVTIARHEISTIAQQRGIDRRRVSQAWDSLARRGLLRLVEPGSVVVKVSP